MGQKLREVKKSSEKGAETLKKGAEQGKKAVDQVKEMRKLIDSLPQDVDTEITEAANVVRTETKSDAKAHMESSVKTTLESGKSKMTESSNEAKHQVDNNKKVQEIFAQMDGKGAFGKLAREKGRKNVEKSSEEFNQVIQKNTKETQDAQAEFDKQKGEIDSAI